MTVNDKSNPPDPEDTGVKLAQAGNGGTIPPIDKRFKKGFDPRRNLKGVPPDAIAMRKHMRKIAAEIIGGDDTAMTRLDALLRQLFTSRNPAHNKMALQVLDPKILTEQVDLTNSDGSFTKVIRVIEHDDNSA